jgi:copper(I)-binding protein
MNTKKIMHLILTVLFAIILFSCSRGEPEIAVTDVKLIPSPVMIGSASSFMTVSNNGTGADALIGCSIKEYPSVKGKIHDVIDGRMKRIEKLNIPSGSSVQLKKGGKHLMFSGLPEEIGNEVMILLNFQRSGTVEVKGAVVHHKSS